jgi:MYND finger
MTGPISTLMPTLLNKACGSCAQPETTNSGKLKTCAKCHLVYYCSPSCQKARWPAHKEKCKEYVNVNQQIKKYNARNQTKWIRREIRIIISHQEAHNLPHSQTLLEEGMINYLIRMSCNDSFESKKNQT